MYVCTMYVCVYVCMYVCIVYACMYARMYVQIYVCMHVCIEPYRLGLAQGRLQAGACSLELSSPNFGYLVAIGCREWAKGLRGCVA